MKLGIISDTHHDRMNATPYLVREFKKIDVEVIIHCGDIEEAHLSAEMYGHIPVICALIEEQTEGEKAKIFRHRLPKGWTYTYPKKRIVNLKDCSAYVGHKRAYDWLIKSEGELKKFYNELRTNHNNLRLVFSGHTHHQLYMESPLISFINPGAVEGSFGAMGGYEYAVIDTLTQEAVFSRIPECEAVKDPLKVAVISDSLDISQMDPLFWDRFAQKLKKEEVSNIIHCGNLSTKDIGCDSLNDFHIYYNLRPDQNKDKKAPNWTLIDKDRPIVEINGYRFCVILNLGPELKNKSESQMQDMSFNYQIEYPEINFILCGSTSNAFLEEAQNVTILNPGDVRRNKDYAIIDLPKHEITFGHLPNAPLPPLAKV